MEQIIILSPRVSFEDWLRSTGLFSESTIKSRVANAKMLESVYGDLKELWMKDGFKSLLEELSYSKKDMYDGAPSPSRVPINGNIYNGLATYRSTLRLYAAYLAATSYPFGEIGKKVCDALNKLPHHPDYKDLPAYSQTEVKKHIAIPLMEILKELLEPLGYNFDIEVVAVENDDDPNSTNNRDRYDICGYSDGRPVIIIEIDTHRSDQVAKKVVSRVALNSDSELLYVSLVYPNEHVNREAEKKECEKYFGYLRILFSLFGLPSKKFIGYKLY